jgi:P27 family predicted phage terminase small subunit
MPGGRPAKPTAIKLLEGNPGQRRIKPEPQPTRGIPPCPAWLDPEAKREWRRVTPELDRLGVLTVVDRAALAAYCQAASRVMQAERALTDGGLTVEVYKEGLDGEMRLAGIITRPEVAIALKYYGVMKSYLVDFGLTPASRTKLAADPAPKSDGIVALLD